MGAALIGSILWLLMSSTCAPPAGLRARDARVDGFEGEEGCRDRHSRRRAHVLTSAQVPGRPREGRIGYGQ